jgi:hypothetical protein
MIDLYNRETIVKLGEKVHSLPVISIYLDTSKTRPDSKKITR